MARVISGDGYYMITPPVGYAGKTYIGNRYAYEHRLLMEEKIGRLLDRKEVVDHVNGNKLDNRVENLQILSPVLHGKKHAKYAIPFKFICPQCGKEKIIADRNRKFRKKTNKMKLIFCSRSCATTYQFHTYFRGSSTVEQTAVNRKVAGAEPALGANVLLE